MHFELPGSGRAVIDDRIAHIEAHLGVSPIEDPGQLETNPNVGCRCIGPYTIHSADVDINVLDFRYLFNNMVFCGLENGSQKIEEWTVDGDTQVTWRRIVLKAKYFDRSIPSDAEVRHTPFTVEMRWTV